MCYSAKFHQKGPIKFSKESGSQRKPRVDELLAPKYPPEGSDKELYIIETIEGLQVAHNKKEIYCTTKINGHNAELKIDTGARCNVMALSLFERVKDGEIINK